MLPVRHLPPIILMAVNYFGRQLAQRIGLAIPAYIKKEGVTPHPDTHKHSLQYDRRADGRFVGTGWDVELGNLSGKSMDVCKKTKNDDD